MIKLIPTPGERYIRESKILYGKLNLLPVKQFIFIIPDCDRIIQIKTINDIETISDRLEEIGGFRLIFNNYIPRSIALHNLHKNNKLYDQLKKEHKAILLYNEIMKNVKCYKPNEIAEFLR